MCKIKIHESTSNLQLRENEVKFSFTLSQIISNLSRNFQKSIPQKNMSLGSRHTRTEKCGCIDKY